MLSVKCVYHEAVIEFQLIPTIHIGFIVVVVGGVVCGIVCLFSLSLFTWQKCTHCVFSINYYMFTIFTIHRLFTRLSNAIRYYIYSVRALRIVCILVLDTGADANAGAHRHSRFPIICFVVLVHLFLMCFIFHCTHRLYCVYVFPFRVSSYSIHSVL